MPSWPSIPAWRVGVSLQVDPVLRSKQPGYRNQRRAFDRRNDVMSVQLLLTVAEFATFETFVQTTLNQGADQFTGPYYDGAGYNAAGTLQIVGGDYTATWDGSFYTVSAQIQVFNRQDPEPEVPAFLYTIDYPISQWSPLMDALAILVNENDLDE